MCSVVEIHSKCSINGFQMILSFDIRFPLGLVQLFHSSSALTLDTSFNKIVRLPEGASLELVQVFHARIHIFSIGPPVNGAVFIAEEDTLHY